MNRQERRKLGIKDKEPVYNFKMADIERLKEDATAKATEIAFLLMLGIPTMIIHDKYPQLMKRDKREETFTNLCLELYDTYRLGYVSLFDLQECLKQEAGINVRNFKHPHINHIRGELEKALEELKANTEINSVAGAEQFKQGQILGISWALDVINKELNI